MNIFFFLLPHLCNKCSKNYCAKTQVPEVFQPVPISHFKAAYEPHKALVGRRTLIGSQTVVNQWENTSHNLNGILVYHQLMLPLTVSQNMPECRFFSEFIH